MNMKSLGALALVFVMTCITSAAVAQPLPDEDDLPDVPVVNCEEPGEYQEPDSSPTPADPLTTPACRAKGEKWDGPTPRPAPFAPEGEHPSPGSAEEGGSSSPEGGDPEETDTPEPSRPWTPYNGAMSGIQLSQGFTGQVGIYAALQVRDSGVPRNSSQYLSQRVLAKSCDNNNWLEIGWAEAGWRDDRQYIYTHDTPSSSWVFYDQYPLTPGQTVYVMVTQAGSNSNLWQTWLHWNGGWHLLRETVNTAWLGCGGEVMVDRYQTGNGTYFNINGTIETGDGSSTGVQVKETGSGLWRSWDSNVPTATYPGEPGWCSTLVAQFTSPYTKWKTDSVNCAPTTTVSVSPASGTTNTIFTGKLSGTMDPNGDLMSSLRIDWGDGTSSYPQGVNDVWTHQYSTAGSYQVRGYACDKLGACAYSAPQSVHVDTFNQAPVITFNVSPTSGDRSTVFNANFNGTYDPNNDPISYRIDWGDGWINNSQNANHRYQNAGTYTVTGRACDGFGACSTSSRSVTVAFSNRAPSANLTVNPKEGDLQTAFNASLSGSDPDGDSVTYEIDWGDGTVTQGPQGEHTYANAGNYVVTGTVRDQYGAFGEDTENVRVCEVRASGACTQAGSTAQQAVEDCYALGACPEDPVPPLPNEVTHTVAPVLAQVPKVPVTTSTQNVLVVDANVLQAYATSDPAYTAKCDVPNASKTCDEDGRERRFAKRVYTLSQRSRSDSWQDGMGRAPDIILLQEARFADANNIAKALDGRFYPNDNEQDFVVSAGRRIPEIQDPDHEADWCAQNERTMTVDQCMEAVRIKTDSAIIYNINGVEPLNRAPALFYTHYAPSERCEAFVDSDIDGEDDCEWAKWKGHYLQAFAELNRNERRTGYRIGVSSIHFVTRSHFSSEAFFDTRSREWVDDAATQMSAYFDGLRTDALSIGGDFNNHKCTNKQESGDPALRGDFPENTTCLRDDWWNDITQEHGYIDTIFEEHRGTTTESERLVPQYNDGGNATRPKRIDYIFARDAVLVDSSHDRSCGFPFSCRNVSNADYYSDHRLLWALLQP